MPRPGTAKQSAKEGKPCGLAGQLNARRAVAAAAAPVRALMLGSQNVGQKSALINPPAGAPEGGGTSARRAGDPQPAAGSGLGQGHRCCSTPPGRAAATADDQRSARWLALSDDNRPAAYERDGRCGRLPALLRQPERQPEAALQPWGCWRAARRPHRSALIPRWPLGGMAGLVQARRSAHLARIRPALAQRLLVTNSCRPLLGAIQPWNAPPAQPSSHDRLWQR